MPELRVVRQTLGRSLFGLVAGPNGPTNRARIHHTPGPRWFAENRPIRRVHGDASMFVGGLRFDTSFRDGPYGTRWQDSKRGLGGFAVTHPVGL